jgi:hypothetical protein
VAGGGDDVTAGVANAEQDIEFEREAELSAALAGAQIGWRRDEIFRNLCFERPHYVHLSNMTRFYARLNPMSNDFGVVNHLITKRFTRFKPVLGDSRARERFRLQFGT